MNMKKVMTLAALTAAGAASAVVTTDNTLCRIEVASGTASTIVAVPLVKVGDGTAIPVTQLVLTDNLTAGDTLLHWNKESKKWEAWAVNGSAWEPLTVTEGVNPPTWTKGADNTTLACGDAIWVNRKNPTNPFYIYGQVAATPGALPSIVRPTKEGELAYTMMGNTALEPVAINSIKFTGTKKKGDKIAIATTAGIGAKEYTYNGTVWTEATLELDTNGVLRPTVEETKATIPAGQGFWYISK